MSVTFGTGRTLLFLDVGFQVLGDLPALELRDGILMSAAIGHGLADGRTTAIASFSAGSEVIDGVDPGRTLALVLGRRVSSALSLSLGGRLGLTESDADYSVLIGWRAQLLNRQR